MWESLMRGDTTASQAFMTHPTYGDAEWPPPFGYKAESDC